MNGNFLSCLAVTLREEGGWSNDPRDPGGATMEGVTQRVYDAFRVKSRLARQGVAKISASEVEAIYRDSYWMPAGCETMPKGLDMAVFDCAVNSGVAEAKRLLEGAKGVSTGARIVAYSNLRLGFMHRLRTWRFFDKGWTARVKYIESKALAMEAVA